MSGDREQHDIDRLRVVEVALAPNEVIADIWRQVLAEEGIVAALRPLGLGQAYVSNALNQHVILVREDQAERAREVIAALESDESSDES